MAWHKLFDPNGIGRYVDLARAHRIDAASQTGSAWWVSAEIEPIGTVRLEGTYATKPEAEAAVSWIVHSLGAVLGTA